MRDNAVFFKDVNVPEIVQKKADCAFSAIKAERNGMVNAMEEKKWKRHAQQARRRMTARLAAAACAAVMIAAGALLYSYAKKNGTDQALFTAMDEIDKMFTLRVNAAEPENGSPATLTGRQAVPIAIDNGKQSSWSFGADGDESDTIDYCISIPTITCEGEGITSVTYSVNHGAFQIVQPENEDSIVIGGTPYDGESSGCSIGGDYDESREGRPSRPFETVFYQSFTLDYGRQSDELTWINLYNARPNSKEIIQLLWKEGRTEEEHNSAIQKMLDGTVITCTAHYEDGSSQSADIKVGSQLMTRKEAGEQLGPNEQLESNALEEKTPVITFELK